MLLAASLNLLWCAIYCNKIFNIEKLKLFRFQAHILVRDCLRGHGLCRHLPLQQHHRLHERDGGDDGGHDDGPPLRGLLPLRGCLQHQPGGSFKMLSAVNKKWFFQMLSGVNKKWLF